MHITLIPFGSSGDVFPFIWLGRQLRARGHEVTVITACVFEEAARTAGLEVEPLGTREEFEAFLADPRLWRLFEGTRLVFEYAGRAAEMHLAAILDLAARGRKPDLLVAPCTAFGARLAREKLGIPLVTVHLQPAAIISAHEFPVLAPGMERLRSLPLWLRKWLVRVPNPADRFAGPFVGRLCRAHGIAAPRSLWWDWANSPDGVLCLFPEWFAAPQPDWPRPHFQGTFPLEDLAAERPLTHELRAFLDAGERAAAAPDGGPIVFTAGSANIQAAWFFEVALAAVTRLGRRAIFVTRDLSQVPAGLPHAVLPVEYAPFSTLLPHAAAFVHHGGIGTLSQALAAGVPQIITPMAHDQPDNAYRLKRLGAGLSLERRDFTAVNLAESLCRVRDEKAFAERCASIAARLRGGPSAEELVSWVLMRGQSLSVTRAVAGI